MPKRSSRPPEDENEAAFDLVSRVTEDSPVKPKKNPHAVALGRKGGRVGGPARAAALSPQKRKAIAKKAAEARWNREKPTD